MKIIVLWLYYKEKKYFYVLCVFLLLFHCFLLNNVEKRGRIGCSYYLHCTHRCSNWWMLKCYCSDVGWVGGVWVLRDLSFTAKQLVLWYSNMMLMIMRRTSNWICHRCPLPLPYKSALPFNLWHWIGIMCRMWRRKVLGGWVLWCGKGSPVCDSTCSNTLPTCLSLVP